MPPLGSQQQEVLQALAQIVPVLLPASLHSLHTAARLLELDGIGCTVIFKVPEKRGAPVEASLHSGRFKVQVTPVG